MWLIWVLLSLYTAVGVWAVLYSAVSVDAARLAVVILRYVLSLTLPLGWRLPVILRSVWMLPALLQRLLRALILYVLPGLGVELMPCCWSGHSPSMLLLEWMLSFVLLSGVKKTLYLAVC